MTLLRQIAAPVPDETPGALDFLQGGGETGALMRAFDWANAPLGPPEFWDPALKTAVRLMLDSKHAMSVNWGPEQTTLYNDGYIPILGTKHPMLFGRPAQELWSEVWGEVGPMYAEVLRGEGNYFEDLPVALAGRGHEGLSYFCCSHTPLRDAAGAVHGIFTTAVETTRKMLAERRLESEAERWHRMFEQAPSFICTSRGPDHVYEFCNAAHRRLFKSDGWVGRPVREAFPHAAGQNIYESLDHVYRTGERQIFLGSRLIVPSGPNGEAQVHYVDAIFAPIIESDGRIRGIFCEGYDVTEQRLAQEALVRSEEKLRLATEAAEVGLWDFDPTTDVLSWPPRVKAMFGISADSPATLDDFFTGLHPADRARVTAAFEAALDPDRRALYDVEYRTVGKEDGAIRWVAAKGRGLFDQNGACVRMLGAALDITARKHAEEHLRLMVNELNHRVKNSLATVQAIAAQTLRRDEIPHDVRDALTERLLALAKAHDVLTDENWSGASLRDIAHQAAAPYEHAGGERRFVLFGPPVNLPPKSAIAMALAFHELATNAAKYGALSEPGGQVRIAWSTEKRDGGRTRLQLCWQETGGPSVEPPTKTGFGTRLIERGLAAELPGVIRLDYRPSGLVCTMEAELAPPVDEAPPSAVARAS